jgi:predicted transcriptional regulator
VGHLQLRMPDLAAGDLPPPIQALAWRERELASAIYREGPMTAKDLQARLSDRLSNAAIRSMLARLCQKGLLKRRKRMVVCKAGARRIAFLYLPAIGSDGVRHTALLQFARDYFDGSLLMVAQASIELLHDGTERPGNPPPSH